ncbi:enoyl-CoA hydratase/isomerase family protein [Quatrionicoccus australiensis]|uniref:enoyl-CoA hydratase/isomerase family protein n=1 Tax=Quatrionicoccus australiensis TaxID=138118 RepID=UPI001CFB9845|nr:enoyl-CoA hydratase/isomerase family protein [Quatrionicoccus australiensis]MCB4360116.1 enoyl-CoA hydratase/isomerase family protein [Quatrionicoccus australiensis]
MPFQALEIELTGPVATIWMNRPDLHNAFDELLIAELTAACIALDEDKDVRVVVLAGRGKSFSAGADLNWMKRAANNGLDDNLNDARALARMLRTLAEMKKPTIARVQGAALGGGMGLAAACDVAVAATKAVFATSEVKFGIIPSAISPYVLRAIGARQATRYFQSAERISAERAREIGLVHECVDAEQLDAKVQEIATALLQGGPLAQAAAKDLIRAVAGQPVNETLVEETAHRIAHLRATPEAREGIAAFLDKRSPAWIGE